MLQGELPTESINSGPGPNGARPSDKFSTWSILLVILVIGVQLFSNDGAAMVKLVAPKHHAAPTDTVSTDQFEQLLTIDTTVKTAYLESLLPPSMAAQLSASALRKKGSEKSTQPGLSPFHATIQTALTASVDALRENPSSTYLARRVMLLRMVMSIPPFQAIPSNKDLPGLGSPLDAYETSAKENPVSAEYLRREEGFWKSTFSSNTISKQQLPAKLIELNRYPTLLFYSLMARQQIFLRAGSFVGAKRANTAMQRRAMSDMLALSCVIVAVGGLFLCGLIVLIGTVVSAVMQKTSGDLIDEPDHVDFFQRFLLPMPSLVSNDDRRLRAGDLLDCFAIYLISLIGLSVVIELIVQSVASHLLRNLTALQLNYVSIGLSLSSYVGGSVIALVFLRHRANNVGASISDELGLNSIRLGRNMVYGAVGWGASVVLLMFVSAIGQRVFHALPAPENPALPMLSFAPNTISRLALYGLAAIAAPFFEETFFRGVLLNALLLRFKPIVACLIVGALFGGIHPVGVSEACSLAALGAVLAWMAYIRKSLAPSMFAHFLQNSFAYTSVYLCFSIIAKR
jgi:membrane protease YdiL (CAAX protease family)